MSTLESMDQFIVPASVVTETDVQLRAAGVDCVERFVLWSGIRENNNFLVRSAYVPRQTAYKLETGLCVRVEGAALHELNVWLYNHQQELAVQVHSHPTEAFHSETDDAYPIVTMRGGLSIVVPNFGRDGLRGPGVAWYRLSHTGWKPVSQREAKRLVQFRGCDVIA